MAAGDGVPVSPPSEAGNAKAPRFSRTPSPAHFAQEPGRGARLCGPKRGRNANRETAMSFRFSGLSPEQFAPLFAFTDTELVARGMRRLTADSKPGYPCRVSLEDAEPGESLILLPFEHQPALSPYRASGPIFVRETAREAFGRAGEIPPVLNNRLLSLRGYDAGDLIVEADVVEGAQIEAALERFFARHDVRYVHIHNARRGCYSCRVDRA
jgi:hypothetical protein